MSSRSGHRPLGAALTALLVIGAFGTPRSSFGQAPLVLEYDAAGDYEVAPGRFLVDVDVIPSVARRTAVELFTGNGQDGALSINGPAQSVNVSAALVSDASVGATLIRVGSGNGFGAGDLVLVVQLQGFDATSGDQAPLANPGNVGRFELARVSSTAGANLTLAAGLSRAYRATGTARTQVVRIPEYTDLTVSAGARLVPDVAWNGTRGGIVALAVRGTLTIEGAIDVSRAGFRGGPVNPMASAVCAITTLDGDGRSGRKGEGIDRRAFTLDARRFGRGNYANGGGGANPHNAGGGGGGNGGPGGYGGHQWNCDGGPLDPETRGLPGVRLASPLSARLFFGGGGGGGQQNDGHATAGARGGGIVLVLAGQVTGGGRVLADGASAAATSGNDGAGGGGAGGSIHILTRNPLAGALTLTAAGGDGGDVVTANAHGPGGGGGGGRVFVSAGQGTAVIQTPPGRAGVNAGQGGVHGSQSGENGGDEDGSYVQLAVGATGVDCFQGFAELPASFHSGELRYLVSRNGGIDWEHWNGLGWVTGARRPNAMDAATLSANIAGLAPNGAFNLRAYLLGDVTFTPAIDRATFFACACGDGSVDPGEECDDGNTSAGDGCSTLCAVEPGYTCTGAPSVCAGFCGNGALEAGEECDDGGAVSGDGCSDTCRIEPGYSCVGAPSVCALDCGDGVLGPGEDCDDGNLLPGDGCSPGCLVEDGYECAGAPSVCAPLCGNGRLDPSESCDDGNTSANDGCSPNCLIEPGYACTGEPSNCVPTCGDGALQAGELCDDGNAVDGDGCSSFCLPEPGWSCSGSPSSCVEDCGDGLVVGSEACDDGNTVTEPCGYGAESCVVCDGTCQEVAGATSYCGDGALDVANGEACDDGNTVTERCAYGAESCVVCDGNCQEAAGATSHCGDGALDVANGEACDDGNVADGDGCSALCQVEEGWSCEDEPSGCATSCGDGVVAGTEVCDDGNAVTEVCAYGQEGCVVCDAVCQEVPGATRFCGDGVLDLAEGETCDDGNRLDGDGCDSGCREEAGWTCGDEGCAEVCGDGVVVGAEVCDHGGVLTEACAYGETACQVCNEACMLVPGAVAYCGDGVRQADAGERCDDGNRADGDGCSAACEEEAPPCEGAGCEPEPECGNGRVELGEGCDDGGGSPGDGCDGLCQVEPGYICEGEPSDCTPVPPPVTPPAIDGLPDGATVAGGGCSCAAEVYHSGAELPRSGLALLGVMLLLRRRRSGAGAQARR